MGTYTAAGWPVRRPAAHTTPRPLPRGSTILGSCRVGAAHRQPPRPVGPPNLVGGYFNSLGNLIGRIILPIASACGSAAVGTAWPRPISARRLRRHAASKSRAQTEQIMWRGAHALQALRSSRPGWLRPSLPQSAEMLYESEQRHFVPDFHFLFSAAAQTNLLLARSLESRPKPI